MQPLLRSSISKKFSNLIQRIKITEYLPCNIKVLRKGSFKRIEESNWLPTLTETVEAVSASIKWLESKHFQPSLAPPPSF